jgi:hypothetical protein
MIPWKRILSVHPLIQILPHTFNNIHIRATRGPIQHIKLFAYEPVLCQSGSVLWVIVLLKVNVLPVYSKIP